MNPRKVVVMAAVLMITGTLSTEAQARPLRGRVFFSNTPFKDVAYKPMARWAAKQKPFITLMRTKKKDWRVQVAAFFKRKSYPGPITVWIYDKADKASIKAKEPVWVQSIDGFKPTRLWTHEVYFDPDVGFNKNHTYIVMVGQIIGGKQRVFARGTAELKP